MAANVFQVSELHHPQYKFQIYSLYFWNKHRKKKFLYLKRNFRLHVSCIKYNKIAYCSRSMASWAVANTIRSLLEFVMVWLTVNLVDNSFWPTTLVFNFVLIDFRSPNRIMFLFFGSISMANLSTKSLVVPHTRIGWSLTIPDSSQMIVRSSEKKTTILSRMGPWSFFSLIDKLAVMHQTINKSVNIQCTSYWQYAWCAMYVSSKCVNILFQRTKRKR